MGLLYPGPWPQRTKWYASINDGASAWAVFGADRKAAACAAYLQLREDAVRDIPEDDPFALDTAAQAAQVLADTRLVIYSEAEWDAACLADSIARWNRTQRVVPADIVPLTGGAA